MKKIFIMAILAVAFVGCDFDNPEKKAEREKQMHEQKTEHIKMVVEDYRVVEIDSCEYIIMRTNDEGYMAHKGNCKYCNKN